MLLDNLYFLIECFNCWKYLTIININMIYRQLGPTGIKVSVISYGNWVNSNDKDSQQITTECVKTAWGLGINFFDTAEVYGNTAFIQEQEKLKGKLELLSKHSEYQGITMFSPQSSSGLIPHKSLTHGDFHANISSRA